MSEVGSDAGNAFLQKGEVAIVFGLDGQSRVIAPRRPLPSGQGPDVIFAVTAMYIRWERDAEWRADLLRWFHEKARSS